MFAFRAVTVPAIAAMLLCCAGCGGSTQTVPQPTRSPAPPITAARGTLAVVNVADANAKRVWVFPPHSEKFTRQLLVGHGSHWQPNSLAFDRRGNLYVGVNDTRSGGEYHVIELNVQSAEIVRHLQLPQWPNSSVATDDHNDLYVNTKSFVGGDIKIFSDNIAETKPYLEIKDHHTPLTMLVTRNALSVGYEGAFANALARYGLRSKDRTFFKTIGDNIPVTLAENSEGSLMAALVRRKAGGRAVDVIDVKSGEVARTIITGNLPVMTGDESGHVYVSEVLGGGDGKIHVCTFKGCVYSIETSLGRARALAVSPLDGMVYAAFDGKKSVTVYDPRTGNVVMRIAMTDFEPTVLALEP